MGKEQAYINQTRIQTIEVLATVRKRESTAGKQLIGKIQGEINLPKKEIMNLILELQKEDKLHPNQNKTTPITTAEDYLVRAKTLKYVILFQSLSCRDIFASSGDIP